jgi:hypothetical protein
MTISQRDVPEDTPLRSQVLHEAATLITGQRQKDYGTPEENFQRIADHWTTHLKKILKEDAEITPRLVAEMMILLKIARTANSPTQDSYVDAAGYSGIAAELADQEEKIRKMSQILVSTNQEPVENSVHETNPAHTCGPWCK